MLQTVSRRIRITVYTRTSGPSEQRSLLLPPPCNGTAADGCRQCADLQRKFCKFFKVLERAMECHGAQSKMRETPLARTAASGPRGFAPLLKAKATPPLRNPPKSATLRCGFQCCSVERHLLHNTLSRAKWHLLHNSSTRVVLKPPRRSDTRLPSPGPGRPPRPGTRSGCACPQD